ncbi:HNH endonuclease signature motif containing protein [Kitasatospora sp. NPDC056181]|uniref:HNH endonuclease signature motif containing protein n=1 Tax=Kitasatospora sp. NPDC056181 TaxID=3345737 RepID=UPI0035DE5952
MTGLLGPEACLQCSAPVEQSSRAVRRLYCSTRCTSRANYLARKAGTGIRPRRPPEERFAALTKDGPLSLVKGVPGACRLWTGAVTTSGYGKFKAEGKTVRAHRFAYQQAHGAIPGGLVIDHLCRVPLCVNAAHLEAVTNRENTLRGTGTSAANARMTHCSKGHPLTFVSDQRRCVPCRQTRTRERAAEKKLREDQEARAASPETLF